MQFNSIPFMLFFPIVLSIYFIIPAKLRKIWLLAASYYFYMSWNPKYAVLIIVSTILTFCSGLLIEKCRNKETKARRSLDRYILSACLFSNLAILAIFKYGDFLIGSINRILSRFHISIIERHFNLLLPVGISFYTFQALGYIIDVYRGDIKAEKNLLQYALFVSFFPQLVAGPIERSKNLLTQLQNLTTVRLWNADRVSSGAILMTWGFFMKLVIADRIAIFVDAVFSGYFMFGSVALCLAAVGFAIQIYCDFGGYSLIAIGASKIMGIHLTENFDAPYFALNIKDFWNRWHISLSTWFRDYLYIPLGGNRKGSVRKSMNKFLTFLLSGLWHGASWHYVIWGGIHGFYQVMADILSPFYEKAVQKLAINTKCFSWKLLQAIVTFILVDFAWIFFRASSMSSALHYIKRMLLYQTPWTLFNGELFELGLDRVQMNILAFSLLLLFVVDFIKYKKEMAPDVFLMQQNLWFRWFVMIALIVLIFIFGEYGSTSGAQQFIYFQF